MVLDLLCLLLLHLFCEKCFYYDPNLYDFIMILSDLIGSV